MRRPDESLLLVQLSLFILTACGGGPGLSGTWVEPTGVASLEFLPDGRVYVTSVGGTFEGEYDLEGERVVLRGPRGSQVLHLVEGRLEAGLGLVYVAKEQP